jgi:hypothetical protein
VAATKEGLQRTHLARQVPLRARSRRARPKEQVGAHGSSGSGFQTQGFRPLVIHPSEGLTFCGGLQAMPLRLRVLPIKLCLPGLRPQMGGP